MPTLQSLPGIEPLHLALEVEHLQREVGAGGVPLHNGVPLAGVEAAKEVANLQRMVHRGRIHAPQDTEVNQDCRQQPAR